MLKNFAAGVIVALLTFALPAQALTQTYSFDATIYGVRQYFGYAGVSVPIGSSVDASGVAIIEVGQKISGRFSFNSGGAPLSVNQYSAGTVYSAAYGTSNASLAYTVVATNSTFSSTGTTASWNYQSPVSADNFIVGGQNPISAIWLEDLSKTAFAGGFPTGVLSLDTLSKAEFGASWFRSDGAQIVFDSQLTSLTLLPVPEPSTWLMLSFGIAAVVSVARRRRG